ncbi:hypothetical protein BKA70DRAFT_1188863 [Coprinopsis sp. MPI-PUGE-AT-0042]|nr:hypothetical protein BKA70DRAFT_1188863 [Coprinopsis sp. MPI-PUGE-AT-0042]
MSSAESRFTWYLDIRFANVVMEFSVAAIQIFMWSYMVSFYAGAPQDIRKRRLPYIVTSLAILILSTTSAVLEGLYAYNVLYEITPGLGHLEAAQQIDHIYWVRLSKPSGLLRDSASRIADAVLVYRCFVVWFDHPWVTALPAGLFLAGLGIGIRTYIPFGFDSVDLNTADVSLTVGLNVLITFFISFRLVRAQKRFSTALPDTDHKPYLGIAAILIESAAAISVFGLGYIIALPLSKDSPVSWRATSIFSILFGVSTLLGPQLIIFRVSTGTSWSNRMETSAGLSRPIAFNRRPQSRSDEETIGVVAADR